jgi:hypothetical protein
VPGPSDLAWWGWLLLSGGAAIAGTALFVWEQDNGGTIGGGIAVIVGYLMWAVAALTGIIGVVRLVKWTWAG